MKKPVVLLLFITLVLACSNEDDNENCIIGVPYDDLGCYELYEPVCGCNGITYSNDCYALAAGISSWSEGECEN